MLDHHAFYYDVYHYDWDDIQQDNSNHNDSIIITDAHNNTIVFNASFTITINEHIFIDYLNDNDWHELHHAKEIVGDEMNPSGSKSRRRLWGFWKKLKRAFGYGKKRQRAVPPPSNNKYWKRKWIKKGRFVGYFPGYGHQKGFPFKKAEKYCNDHYGGLATIFSQNENDQVYSICHQLLRKYRQQKKCKQHCRHTRFRGIHCWDKCWTPRIEKWYAKKYWKGHNCWIGLQLGASADKDKAFSVWDDRRKVAYTSWSPGEPSFRTHKTCKMIFGGGDGEKQCESKRVYTEKCAEIFVYNAGHAKVPRKRTPEEKAAMSGVPAWAQNAILPPIGTTLVPRTGKWNNGRCRYSRVPVCQMPRGQVLDKYIGVRAARSYAKASQWCHDWYGSTLATIENDADALMAQDACKALDVDPRSCWIGLQRPFHAWDDGSNAEEKFDNWAPREPNNAGYNENCVELYSSTGKWNDLGCHAKRYFLCNAQTKIQRMDNAERKKMILKRLQRHKQTWLRHRKAEYRKKMRARYWARMKAHLAKIRNYQRAVMQRKRQMFRQREFSQTYGRFLGKMGPSANGNLQDMRSGYGGLSGMLMGRASLSHGRQNGFGGMMGRRRLEDNEEDWFDGHFDDDDADDDDDNDADNDDDDDDEDMKRKCTFFTSSSGLFEMCIDENGVDVKRFTRSETYGLESDSLLSASSPPPNMTNMSASLREEPYLSYMEYETFKYQTALQYGCALSVELTTDPDDISDDDLESYMLAFEDKIDSYHLNFYRFVYDFDSNHRRQCNRFQHHFELCMQFDVSANETMIEVIRRTIMYPSKLLTFSDDSQWNEISTVHNEMNVQIVNKCTHLVESDMKLCIESTADIVKDSAQTQQPMSLIGTVFIYDQQYEETTYASFA